MSLISVIIPCYNAARTLSETIDSALAQAHVREVIVVDDGSKDESANIIRSYGTRVIGHFGPNCGVSAARNTGIAMSRGEWVSFLDSDDLLEPGTFAKRLSTCEKQKGNVVICDWIDIQDDGSGKILEGERHVVDWPALSSDPEIATATHVWAPPAAILYHRSVVDKIGGFHPRLPIVQDARYLFDAAYKGAKFVPAPHIGARYRILAGSLSRSNAGRFAQDLLLNSKEIGDLWRARGPLTQQQRRILLNMFNMSARALFRARHEDYFAAIAAQRQLGLPMPLHSRLGPTVARILGLPRAELLFRSFGRG